MGVPSGNGDDSKDKRTNQKPTSKSFQCCCKNSDCTNSLSTLNTYDFQTAQHIYSNPITSFDDSTVPDTYLTVWSDKDFYNNNFNNILLVPHSNNNNNNNNNHHLNQQLDEEKKYIENTHTPIFNGRNNSLADTQFNIGNSYNKLNTKLASKVTFSPKKQNTAAKKQETIIVTATGDIIFAGTSGGTAGSGGNKKQPKPKPKTPKPKIRGASGRCDLDDEILTRRPRRPLKGDSPKKQRKK